jgi:hypothetical protein
VIQISVQIKAVLQEERMEDQLFVHKGVSLDFLKKASKITKYLKTQQNTLKLVKELSVIVIL